MCPSFSFSFTPPFIPHQLQRRFQLSPSALGLGTKDLSCLVTEVSSPPRSSVSRCTLFLSPLVGAPSFLMLHSQLLLELNQANTYKEQSDTSPSILLDFIPQDAGEPSTLEELIKFQAVPGLYRYREIKCDESDDLLRTRLKVMTLPVKNDCALPDVLEFCRARCAGRPDLSLSKNNCHSFTLDVMLFILQTDGKR